MRKKNLNILTIFIYAVASVAVIMIFFGFADHNRVKGTETDAFIGEFVLSIYNYIEKGQYEELYEKVIEGVWEEKGFESGSKVYQYAGVVEKDTFVEQLRNDFGAGGWRISFHSLEVVDTNQIDWETFQLLFPKESIIFENKYSSIEDVNFYMASIEGHTIGACSILDWENDLPVIACGTEWKHIVTGVPHDLRLLRTEMWLVDVDFRIEK